MIRDVIFSKRTNWSHEEEYRFLFSETWGEITTTIDMQTNNKKIEVKHQLENLFTDISISKESIKSITFGARANPTDIEKIVNLLSEDNYEIDLYKMKMVNGQLIRENLAVSE